MITSEVLEARKRISDLLTGIRDRGIDTGEFGRDLDVLLAATAPVKKRVPKLQAPKIRTRGSDPDTSFHAALSITSESTRFLYRDIYYVLNRGSKTDEELITTFRTMGRSYTPSGVRSRRAELVVAGWVIDSGKRRLLKTGRKGIVWKAVVDS